MTKHWPVIVALLPLAACASFGNLPLEDQKAILCMRDVIAAVPGVLDAEAAMMRTMNIRVSYPVIRYDVRPHPLRPGRGLVMILGRDGKGTLEYRIPWYSAYQARDTRILTDAVKNDLAAKCGAVESSMVWLD